MKTTTAAYKRIIASGDSRKFLVNINMTLKDGTSLTLTEEDIWADSFSIDTASSGKSSLDIGYAVIGQCSFQIENFDERFNSYDFFNATAVVWVKLVGDTQYYRMGFFSVDEPNHVGVLISLKLLNNMWKFDDKNLSEVGLSFPCSCQTAITTVCAYCGVTLATSQFHGYQFTLTKAPEKDMNCRKFIQYVAMIGCNFCIIDDTGALRLKWYDVDAWVDDLDGGTFDTHTTPYSDGDTADGGNFLVYEETKDYDGGSFLENTTVAYFTRIFGTPQIGTDEITVTGVKIEIDETTYMVGTEGYVIDLKENPLLTPSNVNAALNLIWDVLRGFRFRTFDITTLPDLAVEVGDCCAIRDAHGNYVHSYITNNSFRFSEHQASLGAITPMRSLVKRYSETVQAAVEIARKKTDEAISNYDVAVQLMNSLAINAMGAYQDYEDILTGGRIYYLSNMPITKENGVCHFTPGSTVFMISGSGFFVSTQGGLPDTWDNGYDPETGALLVNILKAIGVEADWIQTGLLRDKDGYNYWDLDHNTFHLAGGTTVGDGDTTLDDFAVKDGTIVDVDVEYNKNQSSSTPPQQSDPNWSTNSPQWQVGYYIWQRTKTTDAEGTVYYSAPACIQGAKGETGADGDDGVGVSAIVEEYIITTSNTTKPSASDPGWSTNQPVWENGKYIWTRSKVTWTNNVITTTEPVLAQGINQANKKAYDTDNNLNQQGIYNRLTQNGKTLGIFLIQDPEYPSDPTKKLLYLNATYMTTGELADKTHTNYWDLDTGDLRMTAGAKIRQTNPDYSGAYVPSNSNSPASSWTTDELKQANVGKTFNNTSTTPATTYIYSVMEYPESAHPYNNSETAAYKFETGLTAPIKVVLNSQSKTESASYDWLDFFYTLSGTTYTRRIGGNIGGMEIIIPTSDFYLYWRTDGSVTDWGWKIDSIESTSGSPEGFSTTTLPSYSWTVVGGKYSWKEATLDNYVGGIASGIIPTGVELTQEEVFNALTNGQQDQGIYIYNGQVYLNASMMNTGYLSANLVNAGSLLADRIHGGTLVIGGDVSQDGKIYLVSNSSTLSTDTNIYSKTASFSYNYTGSLGKYAVSFVISGLSKNDVTFNYSIDMYRSGTSTEVSNGSFNMGAGTNVFTIPYEFDITSTSSSSLYFTIYIESVNSGGSSNKFNLSINYGKIITSLDKNGIKTTSLTADGDCTFGNLYIGKKTVSPWGANIETSYIYSTGYKEYFYRTWRSLTNNRDYYYYFYVCPKADGWTSNCDINVYVNGDDTGSHTTAVYRVAKQTWNGSSWVESEYKTWDIDGDLKHGSTDYFTGFSASDSTTYRFEVKITGYSWASNYEVDIYTDPQHILELSNYGNTGSFSGQISGNGNFINLSFGGFEFTDTQHKLINHSTYETFVMSNSAESVHVDIAYDNIRKNGTTPVMWDSSSDVRMKKNIHDLDVELSREIIDGTQPKSFEYIKEEGVHYGMIAQEARALLDSLGETDARLERTANMPDEETGIEDQRTIYYHEYIPHIINYIKRQEAEINELKAEIKALKGE